jgi:hypothetical protein
VRADGSVTCLTGRVGVNYSSAMDGQPLAVDVLSGFSLDPGTRQVSLAKADFVTGLSGDLGAIRDNARSLKKESGTVVSMLSNNKVSPTKGNNGVGNGVDPQPPGNPPINDGPGTGPGNPGNRGGAHN